MKKISQILGAVLMIIVLITIANCGASFKEVKIGNQVWMAENLNVDKFRNGDPIPHAKTDEEWKQAGKNAQPAWCYYENDPVNGKIYGKLYNWYAVSDWRGLAPEGWRIPTGDDWYDLNKLLGSEAGGKLKETGVSNWKIPNTGASNITGFTALPGGLRGENGVFDYFGYYGYWWSTTKSWTGNTRYRGMGYDHTDIVNRNINEEVGLSVRCVKNEVRKGVE